MVDLLDIQQKLADTTATIAKATRSLSKRRGDMVLNLNLKSLQKRHESLERQFIEATEELGVDVCSYRLLPSNGRVSIAAMGDALSDFQSWISILYRAKTEGPQNDRRIPAEIVDKTRLNFAYSYAGSVGVVMTIPKEMGLFESELDATLSDALSIVKVEDKDQIQQYGKQYGAATVRTLASWAHHHATHNVGADIDWRRGGKVLSTAFVQANQFDALYRVIGQTGEYKTEEHELVGKLVAADTTNRTFKMDTPAGQIRGKLGPDVHLSEKQTVSLPKKYSAQIVTETKIVYATDKEKRRHTIIKLTEA